MPQNQPTPIVREAALEKWVKASLGYKEAQQCCKNCLHYTETDISGNPSAMMAHCTFNRSLALYVEEYGSCNYFEPKKKPNESSTAN